MALSLSFECCLFINVGPASMVTRRNILCIIVLSVQVLIRSLMISFFNFCHSRSSYFRFNAGSTNKNWSGSSWQIRWWHFFATLFYAILCLREDRLLRSVVDTQIILVLRAVRDRVRLQAVQTLYSFSDLQHSISVPKRLITKVADFFKATTCVEPQSL